MSTRLAVAETGSGVHWQQTIGASTFLGGSSVTAAEISAGTVNQSCVGANAVGTAELSALGVTEAKLAANAVTGAKISAGTVTNADLSNGWGWYDMVLPAPNPIRCGTNWAAVAHARLPIAGSLVWAGVAASTPGASSKVTFREAGGNNLIAGGSILLTGNALQSQTVQSAGQAAQTITMNASTVANGSAFAVVGHLVWKVPLTNP